MTKFLHCPVGEMRTEEFHFFQHRISATFQGEKERHFVGAEACRSLETYLCHIAQRCRKYRGAYIHQRPAGAQILPEYDGGFPSAPQADWYRCKDLLIFRLRRCQTHGENRELTCTTG